MSQSEMGATPSKHRRGPARPDGGAAAPGPDGATRIKTRFPSDFAVARDVQRQILEAVTRHRFDAQSTFAIKLALEEAFVNAIKHGNRLDPARNVHVDTTVTDEQAEIIIEDEGPGFDRSCVPDPTAEENLDKCSGRGILLIEAYMSLVEYTKGGRRVRMVKRNGADGKA
jgi:serine/threonine-protein kinase RsbW